MAGISIIVIIIISVVLNVFYRVFVAFAVNNDCRARAIKSKSLWTILGAIIPITALLYLILRNSLAKETPKYCHSCGATSPPDAYCCVNCGSAMLQNYVVTNGELYKKKAKSNLIAAVVILAISLIMGIGASVYIAGEVYKNYEQKNKINDYSEQFPDYYDDFDDFFNDFNYYGEQP